MKSKLLHAFIAILFVGISPHLNSQNLVSNGGFEDGINSGAWTTQSNRDGIATGTFSNAGVLNATSGTKALIFDLETSSDNSWSCRFFQTIDYDTTKHYALSFKARASIDGKRVNAAIQQDKSPFVVKVYEAIELTTDWTEYIITSNHLPVGDLETNPLNVLFELSAGTGNEAIFFFDDIKVTEVGVSNGEFEYNFNGFASGWFLETLGTSAANVVLDSTAENKTSGEASLKVEVTNTDFMDSIVISTDYQTKRLDQGERYRLAFKAKASSETQMGTYISKDSIPLTDPPHYPASDDPLELSMIHPIKTDFERFTHYFTSNFTTNIDSAILLTGFLLGDEIVTVHIDEVTIEAVTIWTGATSTNWSTPSNWSHGVPTGTNTAIIPETVSNYPLITAEAIQIRGLEVETGATIELSSRASLSVSNDTYNNGEIIIDSESSLILQCKLGGDGKIRYTRNLSYNDGRYSVVGSPIENGNSDSLGNFVYEYFQSVPFGSNDGLDRFDPVGSDTLLLPGRGYFSAGSSTMTFAGKPNHGNIRLYPSFTPGVNGGFNLISNPYPCAIDALAFIRNNEAITGSIYIWDDNGSNVERGNSSDYFTVNMLGSVAGSTAGNHVNWSNYLGTGQGFFIQVLQASDTVVFSDNLKVTGNNLDDSFFRKESKETIKLTLKNKQGMSTQTLIGRVEGASIEFDRTLDAEKISTSDFQIYSLASEKHYAIQAVGKKTPRIELGILATPGNYDLSFETGIQNSYLVNKFSGERIKIENGVINQIELNEYNLNAFYIDFSDQETAIKSSDINILVKNGEIKVESPNYPVNLKISTLDGRELLSTNILSEKEFISTRDFLEEVVVINAGRTTEKRIFIKK